MATLSRGQNFGVTETLTNTKLHNLIDLATITAIVNDDIDASAGIVDTKLADIVTGSKVRGTAISHLPSIPSSAGLLPFANIPFLGISLVSVPNTALVPLTLPSLVDGASLRNLLSIPSTPGNLIDASRFINCASIPSNQGQFNYQALVTSLASGSAVGYGGGNSLVPLNASGFQLISVTSGSTGAGDPTSNITIEANKLYMIAIEVEKTDTSAGTFGIRFNDDTGSNYGYARTELNFNTTEAESHESDDSHTSISLGDVGTDANNGIIRGTLYLETTKYETAYSAFIHGQYIKRDNTPEFERVEIAGIYQVDATISSFEIINSLGTFDYTIRVYEIRKA